MSNRSGPVIVICGAPGTGKSTLAHRLERILDVRHRVGVQTVMDTFRVLRPKDPRNKPLYSLAHNESNGLLRKNLIRRSRYLKKTLNFIIRQNTHRGIAFILEGVILPSIIESGPETFCIALAAPPQRIYHRWLRHDYLAQQYNHDIKKAEKISDLILEDARRCGATIINEHNASDRIQRILHLLHKKGFTLPHQYLRRVGYKNLSI